MTNLPHPDPRGHVPMMPSVPDRIGARLVSSKLGFGQDEVQPEMGFHPLAVPSPGGRPGRWRTDAVRFPGIVEPAGPLPGDDGLPPIS
jgi:hypothetical protein